MMTLLLWAYSENWFADNVLVGTDRVDEKRLA
jgi:hypothetical protein